uniref:Uncharacterized protein n=1 Tax=Anguilla anguilla TaxID=7936 RepID=A0A0E9U5T9_ANGAN
MNKSNGTFCFTLTHFRVFLTDTGVYSLSARGSFSCA